MASTGSSPGSLASIITTSGRTRRVRRDRLLAGGRFADNADALIGLQQYPEAGAFHGVAVGDQDPHGR